MHLGRRRRNQKDHEVNKDPRMKAHKATLKTDRDYLQRAMWKKDCIDLKKHLAATMNKVMVRKAANQPEDEKTETKRRTVRLSGNVWRTGRTSLTC